MWYYDYFISDNHIYNQPKKETKQKNMGRDTDFMRQPLQQLERIIRDYTVFSCIAERLEWFALEERHEDWYKPQAYPLGIQLDAFLFPENYIILHHIEDVYARVILSTIAYYEEWPSSFWDIPQSERKYCLQKGRKLYESYSTFRDIRLIRRDWSYLTREIKYFADINKVPDSHQNHYLKRFENAKVIELGGAYIGDASYWAIKRNTLLSVSCGCWD